MDLVDTWTVTPLGQGHGRLLFYMIGKSSLGKLPCSVKGLVFSKNRPKR